MRAPEKNGPHANAVSFFENRNFLSHRPPTKWELFFCAPANAVSLLENRHFRSHRPHVFVASLKNKNSTEHGIVFRTNHDLVLKKKCYTANAVSLLENRHFRSHRPHVFVASFKIVTIRKMLRCKRCFLIGKSPFCVASPPRIRRIEKHSKTFGRNAFYLRKIAIFFKIAPRIAIFCRIAPPENSLYR